MNIFMYHSVSDGPSPLCLPLSVFREQMERISQLQLKVVPLSQWADSGEQGKGSVVLTFDDGYKDIVSGVLPELEKRGWAATIFLASKLIDAGRDQSTPCGELLSWSDAEQLVKAGWEIGSHTRRHRDLTSLSDSELEMEIGDSRKEIEERLGCSVTSFAAPYGYVNDSVLKYIRRHYKRAVGTRLGKASSESDPFDLPRLEIHYFRSLSRFENQLRGDGKSYLRVRKALRRLGMSVEYWRRLLW